jgi:amidase
VGLESVPYDLQKYLERLEPDAALRSFAEFAAATAKEDAFGPGGVLGFRPNLPRFGPRLADPGRPPDLSDVIAVKEAYLQTFDAVFTRERLDGLAFPQMRDQMPLLHGPGTIRGTTVSEINIAGLPGVTVPAGYYAAGALFCLIFVGRQWSEADLLAYAYGYGYEQATRHRRSPDLVTS